jgi:hypothetical protein
VGGRGRPPLDGAMLVRAFIAKKVFNMPTTAHLILGLKAASQRLSSAQNGAIGARPADDPASPQNFAR